MSNATWLYVGGVYAIAIALARRGGAAIPGRVALLFYALVLLFLFRPLTGPYVTGHVDVLRNLPPWSEIRRDHGMANGQMNDVPLQIIPWAHQVRESWKRGTPPIWNALTGCGYPLMANGQSSALSPIRLLALPLSLGHAMAAEAAMKLLLALTFTFLYCRRRWSDVAGIIGAITFGFGGFLFVWLHFPLATTACLAPAVLYQIDLLAERVTFGRFAWGAAAWAAILFGGHPETAAHLFFLALIYALWIVGVERSAPQRLLLALAGALAVAALLAAPWLATFAENLTKSRRYANLRVEPWSSTLPWSDLASAHVMLQPRFFGHVPFERPWGPSEPDAISGFAGLFALVAWIAVAAHVIATRTWRSREAFFLLASLFFAGVIYSWPGFGELFHSLLPLAANTRVRLLLVLVLAILCAAAVDLAKNRILLLLGIAVVAGVVLFVINTFPFPLRIHRFTAIAGLLPGLLVLAVATIAAILRHKAAWLALAAAIVVELWAVGREWNPPVPEELMYAPTPIVRKLDQLRGEAPEPFRVTGFGTMLFPNTNALYDLEDVRVHDPMADSRYLDFLAITSDFDPNQYFGNWWDVETSVLDYLNVRYLLTDTTTKPPPPDRFVPVYDGPDGRIFENRRVLPRFYAPRNVLLVPNDPLFVRRLGQMDGKWPHTALLEQLELEDQRMRDDFFRPRPDDAPAASVEIVEAGPARYRLRVRAPRYTLVVSSVALRPGWKVERNGERTRPIRVNHAFLGFAVPAGTWDVEVWYAPATFWWGTLVSLLTIVSGISYSIARGRAYRRASAPASVPHAA